MGYKREEIRDVSPLSLKKLNDNLRYLWLKAFGNVDFAEFSEQTKTLINGKLGIIELGECATSDFSPNYATITLSDSFKGKDFQIIPFQKTFENAGQSQWIYNTEIDIVSKDKANATAVVRGRISFKNTITDSNGFIKDNGYGTSGLVIGYIAIA